MKKIYILCLLLGTGLFTVAQIRVALVGGPQWSDIKETNNLPDWEKKIKPLYSGKTGINVGLLSQISIGNSSRLFFQPGFFYSAKGRKFNQVNDTITAAQSDTLRYSNVFSTNYIELPLNIGFKLPLSKGTNFFVSAGPYIGFIFSGKTTHEKRSFSTNKFTKETNDLEVGKGEDKTKLFDYGVNGRAGFELNKVLISAYYSQGLSNFFQAKYDGTFKHQNYGLSVGFWLNTLGPKKPKDKDKDGIPDTEDKCPDLAGGSITQGCPDKDADGIADGEDKCPNVAGMSKYNGCPIPDTDRDGSNDEEDNCPDIAGSLAYKGCPIPDTDQDGINDEMDACPNKKGIAEFKGCPIPDSDSDGLNDKEDKCPTEAGKPENGGCPEIKKEIVEKVNYAAKRIFFEKNSDKLVVNSYQSLDEVAKILKENPTLLLNIEGHTDDAGVPAYNLSLSQKRANAVKSYLLKQQIEETRLKATGLGSEMPIADNGTAAGKAQNRRVELKLVQQ